MPWIQFWEKYPALHFGGACLLGTLLHTFYSPLFFLVLALYIFSKWNPHSETFFLQIHGMIQTGAIIILSFSYVYFLDEPYPISSEIEGRGYFKVDTVKIHRGPFSTSALYEGTLRSFIPYASEVAVHDLKCHIYHPLKEERPLANCDYLISGKLILLSPYLYLLKPEKNTPWIPMNTFRAAEMRFKLKEKVKKYIQRHYPGVRSASFLTGLATGNLENRILAFEFNKLGLQHLLAISGFHFTLIALFFAIPLKRFFSTRLVAAILLPIICLYFLFIGNCPSIERAWTGILIYLIGTLCFFKTSGLNTFGTALCIALVCNPTIIHHIGFQLSFAATFGILCFYPLIYARLTTWFPQRNASLLKEMDPLHRIGAFLSSSIVKILTLNLSVNLLVIPLLLFHFHKFPLLSLIYNLFFPTATAFSMLLFFLALSFSFIPPLSQAFHQLNGIYTEGILTLTELFPRNLDFILRTQSVTGDILLTLLTGMIAGGMYKYSCKVLEKRHS